MDFFIQNSVSIRHKNRPPDPQICPARARSSGFGPKPQAVPRMPKTLKPSQRAWLRPVQESVTSCKAWPGRVQNDKRRQAVIGKGFFFLCCSLFERHPPRRELQRVEKLGRRFSNHDRQTVQWFWFAKQRLVTRRATISSHG